MELGMFQRNIGVLTLAEQEQLRRTRFTSVGAGGVGGIAAILAARMGFGRIRIVDGDRFEISNLNRQMFSLHSRIGQLKAEVAADTLRDINPAIEVETITEMATEENADQFLDGSDVVFDATDNHVARVIVHRAARRLGIPSIWIAVTPPFRGGVMVMHPQGVEYEAAIAHPSLGKPLTAEMRAAVNALKDQRALYSVARGAHGDWAEGWVQKERPWAVLAPVANIVGLLASFEALKVTLGRLDLPPTWAPQMVKVDLAREAMVQVESPEDGAWQYPTL